MTEKEFEKYWKANRESILQKDEEYQHAKENFKMSSGADMLLFGIPIVAGIVFMNNVHLGNELLNWVASAAITIVCFAICVWIKSMMTGSGSPDEVEEKIKEIRLVNRAKWLLIECLRMTEAEAHRYIEKQAMDLRISKREAAENIIKTYK